MILVVAIVSFFAGAITATLMVAGWYAELHDELHND